MSTLLGLAYEVTHSSRLSGCPNTTPLPLTSPPQHCCQLFCYGNTNNNNKIGKISSLTWWWYGGCWPEWVALAVLFTSPLGSSLVWFGFVCFFSFSLLCFFNVYLIRNINCSFISHADSFLLSSFCCREDFHQIFRFQMRMRMMMMSLASCLPLVVLLLLTLLVFFFFLVAATFMLKCCLARLFG